MKGKKELLLLLDEKYWTDESRQIGKIYIAIQKTYEYLVLLFAY